MVPPVSVFEDLLTSWDGEQVAVRHDAELATWMFIGVHSTARGPSGGGTRMRVYERPEDGLADALKLSSAMTRKFAVCDVPRGGGKGVLAVPELPQGEARRKLLHHYGEFVTSLGGLYSCGPDMNTSEHDMDTIAETCPYVFCKTVEKGGSGSTSPATAKGVFYGIEASAKHALKVADLQGVRVLVQGMGSVGALLAQYLHEAGADLLVSDVDSERLTIGTPVAPEDALRTECDVLAPCAVGGVINAGSIDELRCKVIAGAANNQLAEPWIADRLHERGILYAPDYVINSGGVLHGAGLESLGWDEAMVEQRLKGLGDQLLELYTENGSPVHAADRLVDRRLAQARAG
jgi:leucine dehydrogenase